VQNRDVATSAESSPWAPLRQSRFRLLWPAVVVSYLGLWMQTVGAQWLLVFAGLAWTAVVSTLNAELQIFLPVWVRGRALAMYLVTFAGTQALASVVEVFRVPSWEEHLRQHTGRLTATDQQIEEAALAFSDPPASADHLLPP
jgi:hypothetical protein